MKEKVREIKEPIELFVAIILIMIANLINAITQFFVWHNIAVGIIITVAFIVYVVLAVVYWEKMTELIESIIAGNCDICKNRQYDVNYGCEVCYCEEVCCREEAKESAPNEEAIARNERIKDQIEEILKRELGSDNISIHVNLD